MQPNTISIKIPQELNKLLEKVSKRQDRSKSSLIRIAIQEYLEDLEDARAGEKALEELEKGEDTLTSWEDLKKELGYVED